MDTRTGAKRIERRAERLVAAATKLKARIEAHPSDPRAGSWRARLSAYADGLEAIQKYGTELPAKPGRAAGIEAPVAEFRMASREA